MQDSVKELNTLYSRFKEEAAEEELEGLPPTAQEMIRTYLKVRQADLRRFCVDLVVSRIPQMLMDTADVTVEGLPAESRLTLMKPAGEVSNVQIGEFEYGGGHVVYVVVECSIPVEVDYDTKNTLNLESYPVVYFYAGQNVAYYRTSERRLAHISTEINLWPNPHDLVMGLKGQFIKPYAEMPSGYQIRLS